MAGIDYTASPAIPGHAKHIHLSLGRVRFDKALYYCAFFILTFNNLFAGINFGAGFRAAWDGIGNALGLAAIALLLFKLCFQEYTIRSLIFSVVFLLVGVAVRLRTGDSTFFFLCLLSLACSGIEVGKLARCLLASCCIVFSIALVSSAFGFASNVTIAGTRSVLGVRMSLGFAHPNVLGRILVAAGACIAIGHMDRRSTPAFLALLVLDLVAFVVADSRTAGLFLTVMAVLCLLRNDSPVIARVRWARICAWALVALAVISVVLMVFYSPSVAWMSRLDGLMSYRPDFWHGFYVAYGSKPFGSQLVSGLVLNVYGTDAQLDGAYATAFIQWGWIAASSVVLLTFAYLYRVKGQEANKAIIVLLAFLVVGLTENYALSPMYDVMLIGIGSVVNSSSTAVFFGLGETRGNLWKR